MASTGRLKPAPRTASPVDGTVGRAERERGVAELARVLEKELKNPVRAALVSDERVKFQIERQAVRESDAERSGR